MDALKSCAMGKDDVGMIGKGGWYVIFSLFRTSFLLSPLDHAGAVFICKRDGLKASYVSYTVSY